MQVEEGQVGVEKGMMIHYISCPPPDGVKSKGTILLVHGFPQTSYQFRRVITPLSDAGYFVVAPDYRGAGGSAKPLTGYTKDVMARDLHTLVTVNLGIKEKIHIVGHDIGGMIVHAYAALYPEDTASLCCGECPLPGSTTYQENKNTLFLWHFIFHNVPDLPELLVEGKERIYLKHFYDRAGQNPDAISNDDLGVYAQAYAQPGALRCSFNTYRTFEEDAAMNQAWVKEKGKCKVPCLALWGAASFADESAAIAMASEFYSNVEYGGVKGSGHWIAEENPRGFVESVLKWVEKS